MNLPKPPALPNDYMLLESADLTDTLQIWAKYLSSEGAVISHVFPGYRFPDDPPFRYYIAQTNLPSSFYQHLTGLNGGGVSLQNDSLAMVRAIGEGIERYYLAISHQMPTILASEAELRKRLLPYVPTRTFGGIHPDRRQEISANTGINLEITETTSLHWVWGFSLSKGKPFLLPLSLFSVWFPQAYPTEPLIRLPISTGAAAGMSLSQVIARGVCEVLERDAFMLSHLLNIPGTKVSIPRQENIQRLFSKLLFNYGLKVTLLRINLDIEMVHVFLSIIEDTISNIPPQFAIGLKASPSPIEALLGAVEESLHTRWYIRHVIKKFSHQVSFTERPRNSVEKAFYLAAQSIDNYLWLRNPQKEILFEDLEDYSNSEWLTEVSVYLASKKIEVYFVILSRGDEVDHKTWVAVSLIPNSMPMTVNEVLQYHWCDRLKEVQKSMERTEMQLNTQPHPFI